MWYYGVWFVCGLLWCMLCMWYYGVWSVCDLLCVSRILEMFGKSQLRYSIYSCDVVYSIQLYCKRTASPGGWTEVRCPCRCSHNPVPSALLARATGGGNMEDLNPTECAMLFLQLVKVSDEHHNSCSSRSDTTRSSDSQQRAWKKRRGRTDFSDTHGASRGHSRLLAKVIWYTAMHMHFIANASPARFHLHHSATSICGSAISP